MRAQMAVFEALVASLLLVSAGVTISHIAYLNSGAKASAFAYQDMAYDFVEAAYEVPYYRDCFAEWNTTCINPLVSDMKATYAASYVKVQMGDKSAYEGSSSSCRDSFSQCYPFLVNSGYEQLCLYACGG